MKSIFTLILLFTITSLNGQIHLLKLIDFIRPGYANDQITFVKLLANDVLLIVDRKTGTEIINLSTKSSQKISYRTRNGLFNLKGMLIDAAFDEHKNLIIRTNLEKFYIREENSHYVHAIEFNEEEIKKVFFIKEKAHEELWNNDLTSENASLFLNQIAQPLEQVLNQSAQSNAELYPGTLSARHISSFHRIENRLVLGFDGMVALFEIKVQSC